MVHTISPGGLPSAKSQREVRTVKSSSGEYLLSIAGFYMRVGDNLVVKGYTLFSQIYLKMKRHQVKRWTRFPCTSSLEHSLPLDSLCSAVFSPCYLSRECRYRLGTINSKSFVSKVLLRIKWKFKLAVHYKHELLGK